MILVSAIHFEGFWEDAFDPKITKEQPFHTSSGIVNSRFMSKIRKIAFYGENPDLQILEIPYKADFILTIILPQAFNGLDAIEKQITNRGFTDLPRTTRRVVDIFFPKFRLDCKFSAKQVLQTLGMTLAFSDEGDFSGITESRPPIIVNDVIHKACCQVDEEGTEAAAATAVIMGTGCVSIPTTTFLANHPFLFTIEDRYTRQIMFMGRVEDPSI